MKTAEHSIDLLRRLLESMLEEPDELQVEIVDGSPKRDFLIINAAPFDCGKIIGKDAAHIRALRFVAYRLGLKLGERWNLASRLPRERKLSDERPPNTPKPDAHNYAPDANFLVDLLEALFEQPAHVLTKQEDVDCTFEITPQTQADAAALWTIEEFDHRELNLLTELGTLFRSIGRRQGVSYRISDPSDSPK